MILNFEELDRKVEKILNILAIKGFSYEIFSNQRINIIDNRVTCAEKRNVGVIVVKKSGQVTFRIYGYRKRVTFKAMFGKNEVIFKPNASLTDVGSVVRAMIKKYEDINKKL